MKQILPFILIAVFSACENESRVAKKGTQNSPDSVIAYLGSAIDTIQRYSVNRNNIDWVTLRKEALLQSAGAQTYEDVYPIITECLGKLKDNHSFFKTPAQSAAWKSSGHIKNNLNIRQILSKPFKAKQRPLGAMIDSEIGELYIGTFASGDSIESLKYVRAIQEQIRQLDAKAPKAWIIVLTENSGGNLWPMLAGVASFLEPEIQGGFKSSDGTVHKWYYRDTVVGVDNEILLKFPRTYKLKTVGVPIAIFIGEKTASSAEALVIALNNNKNVITIGKKTAGLTTANNSYKLMDGSEIILASAVFTNEQGKEFGKQIIPEVDLSNNWLYCCGNQHAIMLSEVRKWIK